VLPRCVLPVMFCSELLCAIVSCTLSTCSRLHTWFGCARPWDWCLLLHLVAAICLSILCPWAGVWLVLCFRRMLTAFRPVLPVFLLLSLGNRSCQRSLPPPCPAMPTTRRRWRWRQCAAGGVWVARPDAARMGRGPGGVRWGAERPLSF